MGKVLCALHGSSSKAFISQKAIAQQQHLWGTGMLTQMCLWYCAGKIIRCVSRSSDVPGRSISLSPRPAWCPLLILAVSWTAAGLLLPGGNVSSSSSCQQMVLPSSSRQLGRPALLPDHLCIYHQTHSTTHIYSLIKFNKILYLLSVSVFHLTADFYGNLIKLKSSSCNVIKLKSHVITTMWLLMQYVRGI